MAQKTRAELEARIAELEARVKEQSECIAKMQPTPCLLPHYPAWNVWPNWFYYHWQVNQPWFQPNINVPYMGLLNQQEAVYDVSQQVQGQAGADLSGASQSLAGHAGALTCEVQSGLNGTAYYGLSTQLSQQ